MLSLSGVADCDAMALMGHRSVLLTAHPRKRNFTHTFWMNPFPFLSKSGDVDICIAYCFLGPYCIGVL